MAEIKYVDYKGLKLYHLLNKKYTDKNDGLITVEDDPFIENNISKHTILVTPGLADQNGEVVNGRKIKVNIDNDSIVFKEVPDELYTANDEEALLDESLIGTPKTYTYKLGVNDSALVPYTGGQGISVSTSTDTNGNTVHPILVVLADSRSGLEFDSNNKLKTALKITKLAAGNSNIGENDYAVYALTDLNGNNLLTSPGVDDFIRIPKDTSLKNVEYVSIKEAVYYTQEEIDAAQEGDDAFGKQTTDIKEPAKNGQFLKFTYIIKDGSDKVVYLDISEVITESEYGKGLGVDGDTPGSKKLIVVIDAASEKRNWSLTELNSYNSQLEGFVTTDDLNESTGENYTQEEADIYNATLPGFRNTYQEDYLTVSNNGVKISGIETEVARQINNIGTIASAESKYFSTIKVENGRLVGIESPLPNINTTVNNNLPNLSRIEINFGLGNLYNISNITTIQSLLGAKDVVYYTQEEANAYNLENQLTSEDEDYKTTESVKTPAVDGLATALDVKNYVNEQVTAGTTHVSYYYAENSEQENIAGLFINDLSQSLILAIINLVFPNP